MSVIITYVNESLKPAMRSQFCIVEREFREPEGVSVAVRLSVRPMVQLKINFMLICGQCYNNSLSAMASAYLLGPTTLTTQ